MRPRGTRRPPCRAVGALGPKAQDLGRWYDLWSQLAERVAALAADELGAGRVQTARGACFRASDYHRTAGVMLLGPGQEQRLRQANQKHTEMFRAGAALLAAPPEMISVGVGGATLPGYFFPASVGARSRPTLVLIGGYDGTCEELYFLNGAAAVAVDLHDAEDRRPLTQRVRRRGRPRRPGG